MQEPLKHDATTPGRLNTDTNHSQLNSPSTQAPNEKRPVNVWKPVVVRVVLSGLALLGLAGVGATSMLAGLDGARAHASQLAAGSPVNSSLPAAQPPATSSAQPAASNSAPPAAAPACSGRTPDGKVILNLATVADLRTLSGIGQKRADAILALRDKLKRFKRIQELRRVRGIGAKTLLRLSPKLLIDPPAGTCEKPTPETK